MEKRPGFPHIGKGALGACDKPISAPDQENEVLLKSNIFSCSEKRSNYARFWGGKVKRWSSASGNCGVERIGAWREFDCCERTIWMVFGGRVGNNGLKIKQIPSRILPPQPLYFNFFCCHYRRSRMF